MHSAEEACSKQMLITGALQHGREAYSYFPEFDIL